MRRFNTPRAYVLYSATALLAHAGIAVAQTPPCADWARLVSLQGMMEARRAESSDWRPAHLHDYFCPGDTLRVQRRGRAALLLRGETVVRLDQHTTLTLLASPEPGRRLLDLLSGIAHFISRVPRSLDVKTPYVNAAVEGTEFLLHIGADQILLTVYEGVVRAANEAGETRIGAGEAITVARGRAPTPYALVRSRDAVHWALYYPPLVYYRPEELAERPTMRRALDAERRGDVDAAIEALNDDNDTRALTYRAALLLNVGRADGARADLERALARTPGDSDALALASLLATARDDRTEAMRLAQAAVDAASPSPAAWLALSYARQAEFNLDGARTAAERAVEAAPENALARARLAEMALSLGDRNAALAAAEVAVTHDPSLARAHMVRGFAHLARIETAAAAAAFERAIALDSADPLSRLGLGLAKIRDGDLAGGRLEIEIAASLDPGHSLVRSYLGKAYYEERRDRLAGDQLGLAKQLDPNDPTPWFYDAIRKQSDNRPVEALHDVQQSIARNDNRAVYRSRLALDQDAADRGASQARIYKDIGFQQLAVQEAAVALAADPANAPAHRFLAELYAGMRRHEIGRASEALQARMFQPLTLSPLPPETTETSLLAFQGAGHTSMGFNEYTPLFVRDGHVVGLTAGAGSNSTALDEVVVAGLQERIAYSFGQYHYETDGFRPNNDLRHDIYNAFVQYAATPDVDLQLELRSREQRNGDLRLRFDPLKFSPASREERDEESLRLGYRQIISPSSTLVTSLTTRRFDSRVTDTLPSGRALATESDTDSDNVEVQYVSRGQARHIVGTGYYKDDTRGDTRITGLPPSTTTTSTYHRNAYLYSSFPVAASATATLGASLDEYDSGFGLGLHRNRINPKFGLQWDIDTQTRLRVAGFRTLKRPLVNNQTLEPTQLAGFNQFFDDVNATAATRYGVGLDYEPTTGVYAGIETSQRKLEVPFLAPTRITLEDETEYAHAAYIAWAIAPRWTISTEYRIEEFEKDDQLPTPTRPKRIETRSLPVGVTYFHPNGLSARLGVTAYEQYLVQTPTPTTQTEAEDEFALVDLRLGYRLPRRLGILSLDVHNLFDKSFRFHDADFQTGIAREPVVRPERTAILRVTLWWD